MPCTYIRVGVCTEYVREPPLPALAMSWPCDPLHAPSARAVFFPFLCLSHVDLSSWLAGERPCFFMRPNKPYIPPPPLFFDTSCFDIAAVVYLATSFRILHASGALGGIVGRGSNAGLVRRLGSRERIIAADDDNIQGGRGGHYSSKRKGSPPTGKRQLCLRASHCMG